MRVSRDRKGRRGKTVTLVTGIVTGQDALNELADILLAVIRIADHSGIDLEWAHVETRRRELGYLRRTSSRSPSTASD